MGRALAAVKDRQLREVSTSFEIQLTELHGRVKSGQSKCLEMVRISIFISPQENEIIAHVKNLAKVFQGVTPLELR
jgi:hypothetical protein